MWDYLLFSVLNAWGINVSYRYIVHLLKTSGECTRITLKVIESLTYICNDSKRLLELNTNLQSLT